jgi:protein SCO1/2
MAFWKASISAVIALVASLLVTTPTAAQLNDGVPSEVEGVGVDQKPGEQIPLKTLVVDSQGRKVRLGDYFKGEKPVLFTLNYSSCPMLCSVQLNQLVNTLDELDLKIGQDFDLITLSIDPRETTQTIRETKQKYVELLPNQPTADLGWHFVTASTDEIRAMTDALGFRYKYDEFSGEYYHPAMLAFLSPQGVITRYSLDVAFPEKQMRMAIVDASEGKVGSVVDQFLMLCFRYDAERNRYVASAWKIMRLGGAVTVVGLLALLVPFWVGRWRPRAAGADGGDAVVDTSDPGPAPHADASQREPARAGEGRGD